MPSKPSVWTEDRLAKLKELVEQGKQRAELAEIFGVTETAIEIICSRKGLKILRPYRHWTKEEEELFKELWCNSDLALRTIAKKLKRPINGLIIKAQKLELGPRQGGLENLSITTVAREMNVSIDRVINWINNGLKCRKKRVGHNRSMIDPDDLLKFLKENQDRFDASKISPYLFANEPNWLKEKRIRDIRKETKEYKPISPWTKTKEKQLISMFKQGLSVGVIAEKLDKSPRAVRERMRQLNLEYKDKKYWRPEEIQLLRDNSSKMTLAEIQKTLKNRTIKGISYRCELLDLKYHFSEEVIKGDGSKMPRKRAPKAICLYANDDKDMINILDNRDGTFEITSRHNGEYSLVDQKLPVELVTALIHKAMQENGNDIHRLIDSLGLDKNIKESIERNIKQQR